MAFIKRSRVETKDIEVSSSLKRCSKCGKVIDLADNENSTDICYQCKSKIETDLNVNTTN